MGPADIGAARRFFYYMSSWPLLNQIFPILFAAPRYILGNITLGVLMQTAQAFGQVVSALSWPIDNLAKASEWRASAERVRQLHSALEELGRNGGAAGHVTLGVGTSEELAFHGLVITDASAKALSAPIDLTVLPGERVMIDGDTVLCGQLFHAVAGLWPWGQGRIVLPLHNSVHFMPERPYIPPGPLHDALCYPDARQTFGVVSIINAMTRAGLAPWADHLEESGIWDQTMSLADQQRLGFVRVLLHLPGWIVLHDATTALDTAAEQEMLLRIREASPGASILIIGGRPGLAVGCDRVVTLARA